MVQVRTDGTALYTGTPIELLEHTTHESVNVDHGDVHIDADDEDHVIRIKHDKNDDVDVLAAIDRDSGVKTAYIDSAGTFHGDVQGSEVQAHVIKFGLPSAATNLETFLDSLESDQNVVNASQQNQINAITSAATALTSRVSVNESDIDDNEYSTTSNAQTLQAATHLDDGTANTLVLRNQAAGTSIDNLHVIANATNYTQSFPPAGLYFTTGTCSESLDLVAHGQLAFQPYTANGSPITSRTFAFGRAVPEQGETISQADAKRDGLLIQDDAVDHSCEIMCSNELPTVRLVGSKATTTNAQTQFVSPVCPVFEVQDGTGNVTFAVFDDGFVLQKGHQDTDEDALNSGHFSSVVSGDGSVYIGSTRLSYDRATQKLVVAQLKSAIPVYLAGKGIVAAQITEAYDQINVHGWVARARTLLSDTRLTVRDVFPYANADWDDQTIGDHAPTSNPVLSGQLALGKAQAEGGITVDIEASSDVHLQLTRTGFHRALITRHSDGYIGFSVANGANAGQKLHINDDASITAYGSINVPSGSSHTVNGVDVVAVERARIDAILNLSAVELDTFKEIEDAYKLADSSLTTTVTNLTSSAAAARAVIQADVDSVEAAALSGRNALQADIDQNESDGDTDRALIRTQYAAADTVVTNAYVAADAALAAAALSGRNALQTDIDQNESDGDTDRALIRTQYIAADAVVTAAFTAADAVVAAAALSGRNALQADIDQHTAALALKSTIDDPAFTTKITVPLVHTSQMMSQNAHLKIGSEHTNDLNVFLNNAETLQIVRTGTEVRYQAHGAPGNTAS